MSGKGKKVLEEALTLPPLEADAGVAWHLEPGRGAAEHFFAFKGTTGWAGAYSSRGRKAFKAVK